MLVIVVLVNRGHVIFQSELIDKFAHTIAPCFLGAEHVRAIIAVRPEKISISELTIGVAIDIAWFEAQLSEVFHTCGTAHRRQQFAFHFCAFMLAF
jgi:hypothetical protein